MYKNRSPNLIIIMILLYSLVMPVDTSRAITNQTELEEPLTVEICKKLLEEMEIETNSLDDPILLEKKKACEILIEQTEPEVTNEEEEASTPDMESPEEPNENEVILPPDSKKDEPVVPSTPESDIPTTPEPSTSENESPMTPEPSAPENENPMTPEPPTPENENPMTPEPPTPESDSETTPASSIPDSYKETSSEPALPTPESSNETSSDSAESLPLETEETTTEKTNTPLLLKQKGVAEVTLVSSVNMTAAYNALQKKITLTADLKSVLNVGLGSKYMVFELPPEIMQSIQKETITMEYYYTVFLGERNKNIPFNSIQQSGNKIYAEVGSDLALSLLTKDIFVLSFEIGQLPVSKDSKYVFESSLTRSVVDLDALSKSVGTATLNIAPVFSLVVPQVLDFGTHQIEGGEEIINRKTAMTIEITHQNALNYDWKLRAKLTKPLTATNNEFDTLENALIFKFGTVRQVLQTIDSEIASGKMGTSATELTYGPNEGILIDVTKQRPRPATYETKIQWTLVNAP